MKTLVPYLIVAVLSLALGGVLFHSCGEETIVRVPGKTIRDTIREVVSDTILVSYPILQYVQEPRSFNPDPDPDDCFDQLRICTELHDELSYENWQLANIRAAGRKTFPFGEITATFSMRDYIDEKKSAFVFDAISVRRDSLQIVERLRPRRWYERLGYGLHAGVGATGAGASWYIGAGIQYDFSGMFSE